MNHTQYRRIRTGIPILSRCSHPARCSRKSTPLPPIFFIFFPFHLLCSSQFSSINSISPSLVSSILFCSNITTTTTHNNSEDNHPSYSVLCEFISSQFKLVQPAPHSLSLSVFPLFCPRCSPARESFSPFSHFRLLVPAITSLDLTLLISLLLILFPSTELPHSIVHPFFLSGRCFFSFFEPVPAAAVASFQARENLGPISTSCSTVLAPSVV